MPGACALAPVATDTKQINASIVLKSSRDLANGLPFLFLPFASMPIVAEEIILDSNTLMQSRFDIISLTIFSPIGDARPTEIGLNNWFVEPGLVQQVVRFLNAQRVDTS